MSELPLMIEFDADLVEKAVLLRLHGRLHHPYWRARDAIYQCQDPDQRAARFGLLHRDQFDSLRLSEPLFTALRELPVITTETASVRVVDAAAAGHEGADLLVATGADRAAAKRSVLIRLRAATLVEQPCLLPFLRHELYHIADMLDPGFGYDPALPDELDPARINLVLARFRVLWNVTIDGRLSRRGHDSPTLRQAHEREFAAAFPMLAPRLDEAFARWFAGDHPAHSALMSFARNPTVATCGSLTGVRDAICPLCSCPGCSSLEPAAKLSDLVAELVRQDFPGWTRARGICPRCVELYEGRPQSRAAAAKLPFSIAEAHS